MTGTEKLVCFILTDPKRRGRTVPLGGHTADTRVHQEAEGGEKHRQQPLSWFSQGRTGKAGSAVWLISLGSGVQKT